MKTGENQPMRAKESRSRNLMRLSEQSSELVNVFKEACNNFVIIKLINYLFFIILKGKLKIKKNDMISRTTHHYYLGNGSSSYSIFLGIG